MTDYTASSDWEKQADAFSRWLPLLAPYGDRLIEIAAPEPDMRVLDMACGTGEPGLTLAHRHPHTQVIGLDRAHAMAQAAATVAEAERLGNIRFTIGSGEHLPFADGCFDRVLCRFGVMQFDDPMRGIKELFRVLKPGGKVALSVWSEPNRVMCPTLTLRVLERFSEQVAWPRTFALSEPGQLAGMLLSAGFGSVSEEFYNPGFGFDGVDGFLELNLTGRFIEKPYQALSPTERHHFRQELGDAAAKHLTATGTVHLDQEAILVGGTRP